jgi:hypothetical protein
VRAAPRAICVFFLRNEMATEPEFYKHARAVLDSTEMTH